MNARIILPMLLLLGTFCRAVASPSLYPGLLPPFPRTGWVHMLVQSHVTRIYDGPAVPLRELGVDIGSGIEAEWLLDTDVVGKPSKPLAFSLTVGPYHYTPANVVSSFWQIDYVFETWGSFELDGKGVLPDAVFYAGQDNAVHYVRVVFEPYGEYGAHAEVRGGFYGRVEAVSDVPESDTAALFGLGLCLTAAIARRRS